MPHLIENKGQKSGNLLHPIAVMNHCWNSMEFILRMEADIVQAHRQYGSPLLQPGTTLFPDQIFVRIMIAISVHYNLPPRKLVNIIKEMEARCYNFERNTITFGRYNQDLFSGDDLENQKYTKCTLYWKKSMLLVIVKNRVN